MKTILFRAQIAVLVAASFILMSFKDKGPIKGWKLYETKKRAFKVSLENVDGKTAACIVSEKAKNNAFGNLYMNTFKADKYKGKRVRFSADIKTQNVTKWAYIHFGVVGDSSGVYTYMSDEMKGRRIKGTTDWKRYELVINVPGNGLTIGIGLGMDSTGKAWITNLKLEEVDSTVALTSKKWTQKNWQTIGQYYSQFKHGFDTVTRFNGMPVYYCKAKDSARKDILVAQYRSAFCYLGKKVRITTYIKSDNLKYIENYTLTVSYLKNKYLEHYWTSHYITQKIRKTQNWTKYETIVYIPENSTGIEYFIDMDKSGEVWVSMPTIEVVDDKTPTSDKNEKKYPAQPLFADGPTLDFVANK